MPTIRALALAAGAPAVDPQCPQLALGLIKFTHAALQKFRTGESGRCARGWVEGGVGRLRLNNQTLKTAASANLLTSDYQYDAIGNVLSRSLTDHITPTQSYSEAFCYDTLNRLTAAVAGGTPSCAGHYGYSGDGNLVTKNGTTGMVGAISYGNGANGRNTSTGAGPHAVSSAAGNTYNYDANGNLTSANVGPTVTRSIVYTPFNLPSSITGNNPNILGLGAGSSTVLSYSYDADHARVSEVSVRTIPVINVAETNTTVYAGAGFFEIAVSPSGYQEVRHYLSGPDGTIGIFTLGVESNNVALTDAQGAAVVARARFWFKDHLGSPASEYRWNAQDIIPMGFDSWGLRRKSAAGSFSQSLDQNDLGGFASSRGYTGHEHLDEVGLIHMNGRIYDPMIGRFLQADPIITEPYNSQSFNRYGYVMNNPLAYTDPSGYSFWTKIRRPLLAIVVAVAAQWAAGSAMTGYADAFGETMFAAGTETGTVLTASGQATAAVAGGFAAGGVAGGNIQSAVAGALQAGALFGVGEALGHTDAGFLKGNHVARIVAHATIGCVSSGVQGGKCGAGAASAGFAAFAGPLINTGNFEADLAGHAVAGGIGGALGGGSFGSGAVTGAFGYLFNKVASGCSDCSPDYAAQRDVAFANSGAKVTELAIDFAKAVVPGGAAFDCFSSTCGLIGWGIAAVDLVPGGGKVAATGGKVITGFTRHGLNQAISRDGVGVSTAAILDAVKNPLKVTTRETPKGIAMKYVGQDAVVVLNHNGQVMTTYAKNSSGFRIRPAGE